MKINRIELLKILEEVIPAITDKEVIEQSTSFIFKNNKIITYNDEICISHPIKNLNINGVIKADEFYKVLKRINSKKVSIKKLKNEIIIKSGKTQAGLVLQNKIKVPIDKIQKIKKWKSISKDFIKALKFSRLACKKSFSYHSVLSYIHIKNNFIEASDGYKISSYKLLKKISKESLLIPISVIDELLKYQIKKFSIIKNWIHFKTENNTIFSCKIANEKYPNINKIINFKGKKIYLSKKLINIIERAKIFSKSELKKEESIKLKIYKNEILVFAETEIGWIKDLLTIKKSNNKKIIFEINPEHLLLILKKLDNIICIYHNNKIKFEDKNWKLIIPIAIEIKKRKKINN